MDKLATSKYTQLLTKVWSNCSFHRHKKILKVGGAKDMIALMIICGLLAAELAEDWFQGLSKG